MFSIDCSECPVRPRACDGCLVAFLESDNVQVGDDLLDTCGYVLTPDVRAAIGVLRDLGMVSSVEIVAAFPAA